jgi:putative SOS response-associated peptidase YedK
MGFVPLCPVCNISRLSQSGLVPSWRKPPSDYASTLKTINCRSDSLAQSSGLWHPIKQRKRCIIPAEGFYEWLHKPTGGKQPYYVKRVDGELMFLAGLWDYCEEAGGYSYTIITTASNPQLSFLHDRMPVILDADAVKTWLDPARTSWSPELQNLLVPFEGELQVYPVSSEVGKVGNDSPSFVEPVSERKDGIKTFFERQKEVAITPTVENTDHPKENVVDEKSTGTTAPRPEKRKAEESPVEDTPTSPAKVLKTTRSAVSNAANRERRNTKKSAPKTKPVTGGNQKITSFFGNKDS